MSQLDQEENIFVAHRQKETLDALDSGEISDLRTSQKWPADEIVMYALKNGILKPGFASFPDPRKSAEVPMEVILTSQVLRSLNDQHSFLLAPYMLNSAEVMTELGYNIKVVDEGFNDRNIHPREAPFHGETIKHILLNSKAEAILSWFNQDWLSVTRDHAPGRTHTYILDGTKIPIPQHLVNKFPGCGYVSDDNGNAEYGYKVVFLYEIIDRKGVIVAMRIAPIQVHDIILGRELVSEFPFEKGAMLIMDRGFIDGEWLGYLKDKRQIDVCIPLRKNMELTVAAVSQAMANPDGWQPHPTRANQRVYEFKKPDLYWKECPWLQSGVLVEFRKRDGELVHVLFVTTKYKMSAKALLSLYDHRAEIEEAHRQLKCFQGLEKLLSKKWTNIVFRLVISVIGYNLFNLFLNSENCDSFEQYSMKSLRQRKPMEKNPPLIIYAGAKFAVLSQLEFMTRILLLSKSVREKLAALFARLQPG